MGVFDKLERGLERAVKQPFARVFKAEVQPVEIASAMRKSMDDRAAVLGPGRTMVPNIFTVELAETDFERLSSYDQALTDELVAAAEDHADSQRYVAPGPFEVRLTSGDDLETGIFRVRPAAKDGRKGSGGSAREYADASRGQGRRGPSRGGSDGYADDRGPREDGRGDGRRSDARGGDRADRHGDSAGHHDEDPMATYRRPGAGAGAAAAAGAGAAADHGSRRDTQHDGRHDGSQRDDGHPDDTRYNDTRHNDRREAAPRRRSTGHAPVALDIEGRRVPLTGAVSTVGRDESCTVVIDDPGASRRHAEIRISHDGPHLQVILRDLGSTNGTYLNGEQVGSEELRHRDRITLGRTHLVVLMEG